MTDLLVIGGGVAGTAAAWFATRSGAQVVLVHHLAGASELYSGAVGSDLGDSSPVPAIDHDVLGFARALGIWSVEPRGHRIATGAGVVRSVRGMDHALLDLEPLAGLRVAVAEVELEHYDGRSLACALDLSEWARATRTRFEPVRVSVLRRELERRYTQHGVAELHDSAERVEWLADHLNRASPRHDAWLLGPWLGLDSAAAQHLRLALFRPVGETTSLPGGAAGDRFRGARDRLFAELGVRVVRAHADSLSLVDGGWTATLRTEGDGPENDVIEARAVVVAIGGLVSGGIELSRPGAPGRAFRPSLSLPVELGVHGTELETISTLHGPALDRLGRDGLEQVGILTEGPAARGAPQLFAAGACVADRPRTVLEAATSGIQAVRAALGLAPRPAL